MNSNGYTPTQQAMLAILADGKPHRREELHGCLRDDMGPLSNVWSHISQIRKKMPPSETIICEMHDGQWCYRIARLVASPYR